MSVNARFLDGQLSPPVAVPLISARPELRAVGGGWVEGGMPGWKRGLNCLLCAVYVGRARSGDVFPLLSFRVIVRCVTDQISAANL